MQDGGHAETFRAAVYAAVRQFIGASDVEERDLRRIGTEEDQRIPARENSTGGPQASNAASPRDQNAVDQTPIAVLTQKSLLVGRVRTRVKAADLATGPVPSVHLPTKAAIGRLPLRSPLAIDYWTSSSPHFIHAVWQCIRDAMPAW